MQRGDLVGKGEIIGTRFQLKLVCTEHRGPFQAHYFIVGGLVGMWQGAAGKKLGQNPNYFYFIQRDWG